ncbi:MAG: hypothetical protein IIA60_07995 [Candidatus Marinimicrobia bacterium]|nr:hypothetical protein [Candidatus Neomarinimicrobiota bacterium]
MKKGWRDNLVPLTTQQSIICYDTEGDMAQMYAFAMYGLGLKSIGDFDKPENQYTIEEISMISIAVVEDTDKGKNPTSKG